MGPKNKKIGELDIIGFGAVGEDNLVKKFGGNLQIIKINF